jgi:glycosyltransferase involved in cell wall biosynthesis
MYYNISFVVPIYNRPEEMRELLESLLAQSIPVFEVVVIEDGSSISSEAVVTAFKDLLPLVYFYKENSGPGDSRNYGMKRAQGDFFVILDSDCILPPGYLQSVQDFLTSKAVDFFGGSDAAHCSFSSLQKAINFVMTSFLTTGGLRGSKNSIQKFEPRSFNMGISREAFKVSGGFGLIHPGEDPDLTMRLWALGFKSSYAEKAYVFHKRRISWSLFYKQVYAFGSVRPILMQRYPKYARPTFWLPSTFLFLCIVVFLFCFLGFFIPLLLVFLYVAILFLVALYKEKNLKVSFMVVPAFFVQMLGYGFGFIKTFITLKMQNLPAEVLFPHLFFKSKDGNH